MKKIKRMKAEKLGEGLQLRMRKGHVVELGTTEEPLTSHAGLSLFYGMAEALNIPKILNDQIRVKCRAGGYPESEHILALAASIFNGGDFLDDMEALREDVAAKRIIGREQTPDPTTAGDFCRRFYAGHLLQFDRAMADIFEGVYCHRKEVTCFTIDLDAKVHPVYGEQKQGAAKAYNGVYSLQPMYAFVHETDEMIHAQLRSGNTHPGGKAIPFLRRLAEKIPPQIQKIYLRSDSAIYNRQTVGFCEARGWEFSITADQTKRLLSAINSLPQEAWCAAPDRPAIEYAELWYQPTRWKRAYRFLVRREPTKQKEGQGAFFTRYSYYVVVTNRVGAVQSLMEGHDARGTSERRIGEFTREFLPHLPMGTLMANWVYLLVAALAYNLSLWIRDLALPPSYRRAYMKKLRRRLWLIASKVSFHGGKVRLLLSQWHRWAEDFVVAWKNIPTLQSG